MSSSIRKEHPGCVYCGHGRSVHGAFPSTYVSNCPNLTPSRCTIDRNHKWCIYYLFAFLDASWAFQVLYSAVVMTGYGYVLSYGQVRILLCAVYHRMPIKYLPVQLLSALFVVPTLISTAKFIYSCRLDLLHLLRRLPRLCLAEAWYLLTGKELPSSYPDRPTLGGPRDQIVTGVRSTHQPLLFSELDCAMWSGWE